MTETTSHIWTPGRHDRVTDRIADLDPDVDFEEIARLLYAYEFSWDIERALEFALFRTCAVPSISGLLAKTGEFVHRLRKRYVDTGIVLSEVIEHGLDSDRGRRSIGRMNAMHGRYRIANAEMFYVLPTLVCEPIRWLDRFGRRSMTWREKRAGFFYDRSLAELVGYMALAKLRRKEVKAKLNSLYRLGCSVPALPL